MADAKPTPDATPDAAPEEMAKLEIRKGPDAAVEVGGLRFVACRREVGEIDGGITLYVWGNEPGASAPSELLRFDLFRERPHYHAPAERPEETRIVADDSIAWGVEALTTRAPALAEEAGFADVAATLDRAALAEAGPRLRELFAGLGEPDEVSYFEVPQSVLDRIETG